MLIYLNSFLFFIVNFFVPLIMLCIIWFYFFRKKIYFFDSILCGFFYFIFVFGFNFYILSILRKHFKDIYKDLYYSGLNTKVHVFFKFYDVYDNFLKYLVMAIFMIVAKIILFRFLIKRKEHIFLKLFSFSLLSGCFSHMFNRYILMGEIGVSFINSQKFLQYFSPTKLEFLFLLFNFISFFIFEFFVLFFVLYIIEQYMLKKKFNIFCFFSFLLILYNSLILYILKMPGKLRHIGMLYDTQYFKEINRFDIRHEILLVIIFILSCVLVLRLKKRLGKRDLKVIH